MNERRKVIHEARLKGRVFSFLPHNHLDRASFLLPLRFDTTPTLLHLPKTLTPKMDVDMTLDEMAAAAKQEKKASAQTSRKPSSGAAAAGRGKDRVVSGGGRRDVPYAVSRFMSG